MYTCVFLSFIFFLKRKGDRLGDMREPLKKTSSQTSGWLLLPVITAASLHVFSGLVFTFFECNPRSQFCPFSIIFVKAEKQRERKGERRKERERETSPSSPLFRHHQEGETDKTPPFAPSFLNFQHQ